MPELRTVQRQRIPRSRFAYVDSRGEGHLPIHDEPHVRNAIARWNQTGFESETGKEQARKKIVSAAKRVGIEIAKDDKIARPTKSLAPARTKRGPRGGRKAVKPKRPTTSRQRTAARRNIRKARVARLRRVRARSR